MVLHNVMAHDDDWATTGTNLADSDFLLGSDGEVDAIDDQDPILVDVELFVRDTWSAATGCRGYATLQLNTWPNTRRLTVFPEMLNLITTDSGGHTTSLPITNCMRPKRSRLSIQMRRGDDWISDASKIYATLANEDAQLLFTYAYGKKYPWAGGPILWVRKVADNAEASTDVFDEAWATDLTGISPGLDPRAKYILRGIGHQASAANKLGIAAAAGRQGGAHRIIGPAGPDNGSAWTVYLDDGIPVSGDDGFVAWTAGGAADTPVVWLGFEEVTGEQAGATGQIFAATATPTILTPQTGLGGLGGLLGGLFRAGP